MTDTDRGTCRFCREAISSQATRCPHCTQYLSPWRSPFAQAAVAYALVLAIIAPLFWRLFVPAASFTEHESELQIIESRFVYEPIGGNFGRITCLGKLRNTGAVTWRNPQIEVEYFDSASQLVDTATDTSLDITIRGGQEITFRVSDLAARPHDIYHSHQVVVRNAREERNLF